jgi:hypothetical protein
VDVGKYKAVTKPLTFEFEGEVIHLTYRPNVYTLGLQRRLVDSQETGDIDTLTTQMVEFIASWDLLEDDKPLPLTKEGIEKVPLLVLKALDEAIAEALIPSEDEKRGSSVPTESQQPDSTSTSSPSPDTSANGSTTSESPTVSESVPTS